MKKFTTEEKKETRDFLTMIVGLNLDHVRPEEMEECDVKEIRDSLPFKLYAFRKACRALCLEIRNAIIKKP